MSRTVESDVRRVGVQFGSGRVDFVLPAALSVAAVIPSIADRVGASRQGGWQEPPADWQLTQLDGQPLSPRKSLRDNAVSDGDLLWLSRVQPALAPPPADDAIAALSWSLDLLPRWTPAATRVAVAAGMPCSTALVAYALLRSASSAATATAGLLAAVALGAALVVGRVYRETLTAVALASSAVASSAVAAYLLVPGQATAPKSMLAAAVGATVSVVAARWIGQGTAVLSGLAAVGFLSAAAACMRVAAPAGVETTGAMLAAAAVALLVSAPRLAIGIGRLPVRPPGPRVRDYAHHAHMIATGLVCGSSAAAALGTFLVLRVGGYAGGAFAAAVGVTLVLRTGIHVDLVQAATLLTGGTMCFAAVAVRAVNTWSEHAHWIALTVAAAAAMSTTCSSSITPSPLMRRCLELVEYAALASLIPLACWVCGAFAAVRGVHLS
ncbi:MAG: type VII secretion integral membrane protein EccD [Mycobacterium sp.]